MTPVNRKPALATESDLERVIEPLASYICATDQTHGRPDGGLGGALQRGGRGPHGGKRANHYLLGESVVMKYMRPIYIDEQALTETVRRHSYEESTQLAHELNARGLYLTANPLHPTATATSVRVRDGNPIITDDPFVETRTARRLLLDRRQRSR